jgi:hypothetical protein
MRAKARPKKIGEHRVPEELETENPFQDGSEQFRAVRARGAGSSPDAPRATTGSKPAPLRGKYPG